MSFGYAQVAGTGNSRMAHNKVKKPKKPKKKKEPFVARMKRRGREAYGLGRTLVKEPRAFPGEFGSLLKRSFRTVWEARGGGFYACGFVGTFIWLELQTIAGEIAGADGGGQGAADALALCRRGHCQRVAGRGVHAVFIRQLNTQWSGSVVMRSLYSGRAEVCGASGRLRPVVAASGRLPCPRG